MFCARCTALPLGPETETQGNPLLRDGQTRLPLFAPQTDGSAGAGSAEEALGLIPLAGARVVSICKTGFLNAVLDSGKTVQAARRHMPHKQSGLGARQGSAGRRLALCGEREKPTIGQPYGEFRFPGS